MKNLKGIALLMMVAVFVLTSCFLDDDKSTSTSTDPPKAITVFIFMAPVAVGVIDENSHTITVSVPWDTVLTSLVPTITQSGVSVAPLSGVAQDFSSSKTYTVTAEDGTAQIYDIIVTKKEYALRDVGPAGGLIFYINPDSATEGWKYLEAAPSDQDYSGTYFVPWGCPSTDIVGAEGTLEGTGEPNTIAIEFGCITDGTPADISANLSLMGYNDWFLPSINSVVLMYSVLHAEGVGGFTSHGYWSSSETAFDTANLHDFSTNATYSDIIKSNPYKVRAVRSF
jgi:hypothetical protein